MGGREGGRIGRPQAPFFVAEDGLVTDKDWIRHAVAVFGPLSPGELRLFELSETALARAWIAAQPPS